MILDSFLGLVGFNLKMVVKITYSSEELNYIKDLS
jgi:hypothetical protein